MRILVVGPPGSGKTHLAARLSRERGISVLSVDDINFKQDKSDTASDIDSFVSRTDSFVLDGNYHACWRHAGRFHAIFSMTTPPAICAYQVMKRMSTDWWHGHSDNGTGIKSSLVTHRARFSPVYRVDCTGFWGHGRMWTIATQPGTTLVNCLRCAIRRRGTENLRRFGSQAFCTFHNIERVHRTNILLSMRRTSRKWKVGYFVER